MSKKVEMPHQVSLRVMRLATPAMVTSVPLQDGDHVTDSSVRLASVFGEIFLGETFSCYLTAQNGSAETVSNVVLKAELQTSSKRYTLHHNEEPLASLEMKKSKDFLLSRLLRDEGVHILVCTASYLTPTLGRRSFRKFFKFSVSQPLVLSHRQVHCSETGQVLVETEVENSTNSHLCISQISFIPTREAFRIVKNEKQTESEILYVGPHCTIQLYNSMEQISNESLNPGVPLGHSMIQWSRSGGESGKIQSPILIYSPPKKNELTLSFSNLPKKLSPGSVFRAQLILTNNHHYDEKSVKIWVSKIFSSQVLLCGLQGQLLGPLAPRGGSVSVDLSLVAISRGLFFFFRLFLLRFSHFFFPLGMHQLGGVVLESGDQEIACNELGWLLVD